MPSQANGMADTIRVLVATDNHVGYNERDPVRGDDSWKTFREIMCLAKDRDVDMVLLGGDLFHDNVPSRKSMYNVMRSLRLNCYGDKPCEVEILSDSSEHFDATIGHANYEDTNINVAIPVFSIHGNHDDPSGDGHFAALDILEMSGLINYFGRVPQNDNIDIRPLLLQKGTTKLALYGLSNVRDERLYQSFKHGHVSFYQSQVQQKDWYSIAVVHQNHHRYTSTAYLPENFLPSFLDLVIWGHEHECDITPHLNNEMNFKVMQPGSSVATSLAPGEAVTKHVAILSITGRDMESEEIRLKTVRPFVYKDIVLGNEKAVKKIAEKDGHRHNLTQWLMGQVEELIAEAHKQWEEAQEETGASKEEEEPPLPLVRLRVEHSSVNGIKFEVENPQRFSNRFTGRVANNHDVIQLHVKKRAAAAARLKASEELKELMGKPEVAETIKVNQLVAEFLAAQSLTILPQNYFGDAVNQYIDKDDKHAMDLFINDALSKQIRNLVSMNEEEEEEEEDDFAQQFDAYRGRMEEEFQRGKLRRVAGGKVKYRPKPKNWDSDMDGHWEDQPAAFIGLGDESNDDDMFEDSDRTSNAAATRGKGRGKGGRGAASTRGRSRAAKSMTAKAPSKTRKKPVEDESEEEEDVIMLDDDDDEDAIGGGNESDSQAMFFAETKRGKATNNTAQGSRAGSVANGTITKSQAKPAASTRKPSARAAASKAAKQSTLSFSASQASVLGDSGRNKSHVSDIEDDDDDDDDAFEPMSTARSTRSRR